LRIENGALKMENGKCRGNPCGCPNMRTMDGNPGRGLKLLSGWGKRNVLTSKTSYVDRNIHDKKINSDAQGDNYIVFSSPSLQHGEGAGSEEKEIEDINR
jgi:hypothetical protein